ncbi:MAG TPA: hypothetical protein VM639_12585 [Dongiaceae bacterium]|nr:hypothetical protein [Dongiaceae bacterium]
MRDFSSVSTFPGDKRSEVESRVAAIRGVRAAHASPEPAPSQAARAPAEAVCATAGEAAWLDDALANSFPASDPLASNCFS